jgi:hypothetical protein
MLFRELPKEIKNVEIKGFLHNLIVILCICFTNIFVWNSSGGFRIHDTLLIVNFLLLVSFIIISIINLHIYIKRGQTIAQIELQKVYNQTMQSFMDETNRIKHSYNNTIAPLNGYIKLKKWDMMKMYLMDVSRDNHNVDSLQTLMSMNIKNAAILGLLNKKMNYASEKGINFSVKAYTEVNIVNSKMYVLNSILGSLIDYSIQCSEKSKQKLLEFDISNEDNKLTFKLKNTCSADFNFDEIFTKELEEPILLTHNKLKGMKEFSFDTNFIEGILSITLKLESSS